MSFKGPKQTVARAARTADSIHGDTSEEVVETEKATSKNDEKAPLAKAGNKVLFEKCTHKCWDSMFSRLQRIQKNKTSKNWG